MPEARHPLCRYRSHRLHPPTKNAGARMMDGLVAAPLCSEAGSLGPRFSDGRGRLGSICERPLALRIGRSSAQRLLR
jgi:hypothetical protein